MLFMFHRFVTSRIFPRSLNEGSTSQLHDLQWISKTGSSPNQYTSLIPSCFQAVLLPTKVRPKGEGRGGGRRGAAEGYLWSADNGQWSFFYPSTASRTFWLVLRCISYSDMSTYRQYSTYIGGRAMVLALNRHLARVRSQSNSWGICEESGTGTGSCSSSLSVIPSLPHIPLPITQGMDNGPSKRHISTLTQIMMAARSKARVCGPSLAGVAGSNPTGGMNMCVFSVEVSASGWSFVQRRPTDCRVSEYDSKVWWMRRPWSTRVLRHWGGGWENIHS